MVLKLHFGNFAYSISRIESLKRPILASKWLKNFLDSFSFVESQHVIENQYYISFLGSNDLHFSVVLEFEDFC